MDTRVIIHLDLDCFYAQVEQKRLNIPRHIPVAVQQWQGLIAVNYAARDAGITRHMRVQDAKSKCPDLVLVHVETVGGSGAAADDNDEHAHDEDKDDVDDKDDGDEKTKTEKKAKKEQETDASLANARLTQKASLERYRRANADILQIAHRIIPSPNHARATGSGATTTSGGGIIEKASIDEFYIDVTAMIDAELKKGRDQTTGRDHNTHADAFAWGSIVPHVALDPGSEFDVRLAAGAGIACRLRAAIREELGYTSSAGIACNKLMAKIGSALNKPDQQTVLSPKNTAAILEKLPLKKLRNFGGKLGAALEEKLGFTTVGEVAAVPLGVLQKTFGPDRGQWIFEQVRGRNDDPVEEKERPKSMLAAKSFTSTSDHATIRRWLGILASELAERMRRDEGTYCRRPRTLTLCFRGGGTWGQERSRQTAMPRFPDNQPTAEVIEAAAWEVFKTRCAAEALPCTRLAISAVDFVDLPNKESKNSITRFFASKKGNTTTPADADAVTATVDAATTAVQMAAQCGDDLDRDDGDEENREEGKKRKLDDDGDDDVLRLAGVNVEEQRRLLKEAELYARMERKKKKEKKQSGVGGAATTTSSASSAGGGGGGIAKFFVRQ